MGQMIVELEGHGREDLFEDIDLSRTVGWFTSTFPVHLTANRSRCIDTVLKSVKESLRNVPNKGIGYGLLRYLAKNEVQQQFNQMPKTEVRLNYLGRFDQNNSEGLLSERIIQGVKHNHSGNQKRQYVLNINAMVSNGQLGIGIEYSKEQLDEAVVASFAEALVAKLSAIVNHCQTPGVGGLTPSDLPDAGMDQQQLDKFIIELADILELV
jgi:non-ribosomal peptide synthase protein (TIGR01720 family)